MTLPSLLSDVLTPLFDAVQTHAPVLSTALAWQPWLPQAQSTANPAVVAVSTPPVAWIPSLPMLFTVFGIALAVGMVLVPVIRYYSLKANLYDAPGERKIHTQPIPRLGGVAIFIAFVVALGLGSTLHPQVNAILLSKGNLGLFAGGALMFILGLLDDLFNLSPYVKLLWQFVAASVAFGMGVSIEALDLPGNLILYLKALSFTITAGWLVGLSNAMNFIDGVDGLAGGVAVFASLTLCILALFTGQPQAALLCAALAGGCLAFLAFNFHPAKLFMGDSGALFIGFALASIAVLGVLKIYTVMMIAPILVLCVPVLDITYAVLRRLLRGKNPFIADGDHLHHRLLKQGLSQPMVVATFYGACILSGIFVSIYLNAFPVYVQATAGLIALATLLIKTVQSPWGQRWLLPDPHTSATSTSVSVSQGGSN